MNEYDYRFEDKLDRDLPKIEDSIYWYMYELYHMLENKNSVVFHKGMVDNIFNTLYQNFRSYRLEDEPSDITTEFKLDREKRFLVLTSAFLKRQISVLQNLKEFKNRTIKFIPDEVIYKQYHNQDGSISRSLNYEISTLVFSNIPKEYIYNFDNFNSIELFQIEYDADKNLVLVHIGGGIYIDDEDNIFPRNFKKFTENHF